MKTKIVAPMIAAATSAAVAAYASVAFAQSGMLLGGSMPKFSQPTPWLTSGQGLPAKGGAPSPEPACEPGGAAGQPAAGAGETGRPGDEPGRGAREAP